MARFVALDAHMEMENEARPVRRSCSKSSASRRWTRQAREPDEFELAGEAVDSQDHRGVAGNVTESRHLGLVIGAGGGSLTLFDAVAPTAAGQPTTARSAAIPPWPRPAALAKLVLSKPGVERSP